MCTAWVSLHQLIRGLGIWEYVYLPPQPSATETYTRVFRYLQLVKVWAYHPDIVDCGGRRVSVWQFDLNSVGGVVASAGILDKHYYQQRHYSPQPSVVSQGDCEPSTRLSSALLVRTKRDVIRSTDEDIAVTHVAEDTPGQTLQRNCK